MQEHATWISPATRFCMRYKKVLSITLQRIQYFVRLIHRFSSRHFREVLQFKGG